MLSSQSHQQWWPIRLLPEKVVRLLQKRLSHDAKLYLREKFGASYQLIPEEIVAIPDGRRIRVGPDLSYWSIYYGKGYEPEASYVVSKIIKTGDVVVDVGANFGWYTTLFAIIVGEEGAVYAFEPVPQTFERLLDNLALNGLEQRVVANRGAVGDVAGTVDLHVFNDLSFACASISTLDQTEYETFPASMITLEDYLSERNVKRVDFIKCDVEGAELKVLKGCTELLSSEEAPIILIELNDNTSAALGFSKEDLFHYLQEHGYDAFYEILSSHKLHRIKQVVQIRSLDLLIGAKGHAVDERLSGHDINIID